MIEEITMRDSEKVASMCSLVGRPNTFLVITNLGHMWTVVLVPAAHGFPDSAHWKATRLPSATQIKRPPKRKAEVGNFGIPDGL